MLTEQQKTIIINSISHLIDFPEALTKLRIAIQNLFDALIAPTIAEDNDNALLHKCLHHPEEMLLRLENHGTDNNNLTIGEVQQFIIDYISSQFDTASDVSDIWKKAALEIAVISETNKTTPFQSRHRTADRVDGDNLDYTLDIDKEKNFSGNLVLEWPYIHLHLMVNYSATEQHTGTIPLYSLVNFEELEELTALERASIPLIFKEAAAKKAWRLATLFTLQHLTHRGIVDFNYSLQLYGYNPTIIPKQMMPILTNTKFLSFLTSRKIAFSDIQDISEHQANVLINPTIIKLIEKSEITINNALQLSAGALKILSTPYFSSAIAQNPTLLEKIKFTTNNQAQLLSNPNITQLIKENKLDIDTALKLSSSFARLISEPFYLRLAKSENVDWAKLNLIINEYSCALLLHSKAINLFSTHSIPLNEISTYIPQIIEETRGQRTRDLVMSGHLSMYDMMRLSDEVVEAIEKHPSLCKWIKYEMLKGEDFNKTSAIQLIVTAYSNRLSAIYKSEAYEYKNGHDTVETILTELASEDSQYRNYIHEMAVQDFLTDIELDLNNALDNDLLPATIKSVYQALNDIIEKAQDDYKQSSSSSYWRDCLTRCLAVVSVDNLPQQESQQKMQRGSSGFFEARHAQRDVTEFQAFCEKLREFEPLSRNMDVLVEAPLALPSP